MDSHYKTNLVKFILDLVNKSIVAYIFICVCVFLICFHWPTFSELWASMDLNFLFYFRFLKSTGPKREGLLHWVW